MGDSLSQQMGSSALDIQICASVDISLTSLPLGFQSYIPIAIRGITVHPI
jgi:hypothetical protein